MSTTARTVSDYIKAHTELYGKMHLQKLLYYTQAWSLTWTGDPLFVEPIEAWEMGPVVADEWRGKSQPGKALTSDQEHIIDAVLRHFHDSNGSQLSELTHRESPWKDIWEAHQQNGRCSAEIPNGLMRREYTKQSMLGVGPIRPTLNEEPLSDERVLTIAREEADRWADALELLAR